MSATDQGAHLTEGRWLTINRTLCFVRHGNDVLLLRRSPTKRIFPNRYNGVGGHIERGEDPLTGARREILEETGLHVRDVALRAVYTVDAGEAAGITVFAFTAWSDTREVIDCDEGQLEWVPMGEVTARDLVDDLYDLLPRMLAMDAGAPPFFVHLSYNERDQLVVRIAE